MIHTRCAAGSARSFRGASEERRACARHVGTRRETRGRRRAAPQQANSSGRSPHARTLAGLRRCLRRPRAGWVLPRLRCTCPRPRLLPQAAKYTLPTCLLAWYDTLPMTSRCTPPCGPPAWSGLSPGTQSAIRLGARAQRCSHIETHDPSWTAAGARQRQLQLQLRCCLCAHDTNTNKTFGIDGYTGVRRGLHNAVVGRSSPKTV